MNNLLESLVTEFGIIREAAQVEYKQGNFKPIKPPDRLSPEEYTELLFSDHYSIPSRFKEVEYEEGEFDYVPTEYTHIYYRTLAIKDSEFHDWVICTVSRKYWLRFAEMAIFCQENGYELFEDVLQKKMEESLSLLYKGLVNKKLYRPELRLRNELLQEAIEERRISA